MRTILFVNGVIKDYEWMRPWLRPDDYLVAADGGTRHALALGLRPHVIVGDLDSLEPVLVEQLAAQGTGFERHPAGKDATDLELALDRAIRDGASEIVILGALGGRLDLAISNVLILAQRVWPVPIWLVEEDQVATILRGGETLTLSAAPGATVSLLPLTAEVTGITYHGLLYPLTNATLKLGSTRGVSNVVAEHPATVQIAEGIALVVQSAPEPPSLHPPPATG